MDEATVPEMYGYACRICTEIVADPFTHAAEDHRERFEGQPLMAIAQYFNLTYYRIPPLGEEVSDEEAANVVTL